MVAPPFVVTCVATFKVSGDKIWDQHCPITIQDMKFERINFKIWMTRLSRTCSSWLGRRTRTCRRRPPTACRTSGSSPSPARSSATSTSKPSPILDKQLYLWLNTKLFVLFNFVAEISSRSMPLIYQPSGRPGKNNLLWNSICTEGHTTNAYLLWNCVNIFLKMIFLPITKTCTWNLKCFCLSVVWWPMGEQ